MRNYFLILVIIYSSLTSFAMLQEENTDPLIQKISDTLFISKIHDDLFFVMEKLDDTNIASWQEYVRLRYHHEVVRPIENKIRQSIFHLSVDKDSPLDNLDLFKTKFRYSTSRCDDNPYHRKIIPLLSGDAGSFSRAVRRYVAHHEKYPTNETWIVYALSSSNAPTGKCTIETLQNIEMCFTVNTDEDAPFTTHQGIQRSLVFMQNYLEEEIRFYRNPVDEEARQFLWHGRISVWLHKFGLKVTSIKYPEKIYMITQPMSEMRYMLLKETPPEAIWLGSEYYHQLLQEDESIKWNFWSDEPAKFDRQQKLYAPSVEKIWEKQYSPISCTNEYFTKGRGRKDPSTWEAEGIPEDFTWTLRNRDGNVAIHFDSSSLQLILERYQWFFMESHVQPSSIDEPYVIVDIRLGGR